jgi:hypothetical protein
VNLKFEPNIQNAQQKQAKLLRQKGQQIQNIYFSMAGAESSQKEDETSTPGGVNSTTPGIK